MNLLKFIESYPDERTCMLDMKSKIEKAELVVEGEVIESECFRTNSGDMYTAHKLKIYKSFKNSISNEFVSVVTRGGILEQEEQTWTHLLTLSVGAKGIFFLHKTTSPPYTLEKVTDSYYSVFSSEQGFLKYDWDGEMLRAYEPFHQYKNVQSDIFERLQKDYDKPYHKIADNSWSYTEKTEKVIQTYTTQVKSGDKCLDFLFEVMSPDPSNIFQVTTVVSIKSTELTPITRPVIALKYSASALGPNIAANNLMTLEQIGVSDNVNYTSVLEDIAPDKVRIDIQATSLDEPDLFVITDTYTTLIKIHLTLPGPLDPGLLLDQEMMESLSKYFDFEEGIEKYFDCMRIEGDFSTFQCPIAVVSGFNATSLSDTTVVFPADSMRAGTDDVLIISGACFGSSQGNSYVEFTNAKNGPDAGEWVKPLEMDYSFWSDTEIRVLVPSRGIDETPADGIDNSRWYAGTGPIRVNIDGVGSPSTSTEDLYIRYAVTNNLANAPNLPDDYPNHSLIVNLNDLNEAGGYTLFYDDNFLTNLQAPDADLAFERALLKWRCATNVNFTISDISNIPDTSVACRIEFGILPVGIGSSTLGKTYLDYGSCTPTDVTNYSRLEQFRVRFNQAFAWHTEADTLLDLEGTQIYDIESVALHELGHAQLLEHSNNPNDLMHYTDASYPTHYNRNIKINDLAGANFMVNHGVNSISDCAIDPMLLYTLDDCTVIDGVTEYNTDNEFGISIYPNPALNQIKFKIENSAKIQIRIYNLIGELFISKTIFDNTVLDIQAFATGVYVIQFYQDDKFIGLKKLIKQK